jgi:thiol-disulfide isomerase/thioredoxin
VFRKIGLGILLLLVLSACSGDTFASTPEKPELSLPPSATSPPTEVPIEQEQEEAPLSEEPPPFQAETEFNTDFTRHSVPYSEILSGGPPKDGIPAIDTPSYVSVEDADTWLGDQEPVILLRIGDAARAYPLQILMWHEIVNDELNGNPVVVSFCPLCNTAIAFDRHLDDRVLDFGTTGRLRFSNLIMYDRQTETWWQQATGEGIVGEYTGRELSFIPANIVSWADFRESYPEADVLSRNTGYSRSYGENPYPGYDNVENSPFLYDGPATPGTLTAMARVLAVDLNNDAVAYPYDVLSEVRVVEDIVGGIPIVVFWQTGTASALDNRDISSGSNVGSIAPFSRIINGQLLTFEVEDEVVVDIQTGSTWDVLGRAIDGPMQGHQLDAVVGVNHFWFSWAAFKPETRVYATGAFSDEGVVSDSSSGGEEDETNEQSPEVLPSSRLPMDFEIVLYTGKDVYGGETVFMSDILAEGKPVVLVFWAGLCPFCRREMPDVQAAYLEYGDRVNFIGIDVGLFTNLGSRADAETLIEELGLEFPTGATMDFQVMPAYEVTSIPTTLFMKPNGLVLRRESTVLGRDALFEQIESLIDASTS